MRIGVNALYLIPGAVGGTEIYLRELLAALARLDRENEYFIFRNLETGRDLVPRAANFHDKPQAVRARFRPARILWEQTILPLEASRYRIDVLFNPGFTAPVFARCACVTTFHDLQHKRHPEYFRWFDLPFWNLLLWASAKRSRLVLADSQATRADVKKYYPFAAGRTRVAPLGVSPDFFSLDRSRVKNFVLCVSTLHPHKNLQRLIRAFANWESDWRLVLAGMRGFHGARIEALIEELRLGDRVRLTGWIPRPELLDLYARAKAFVYPSTFEGFGIPVLEAMAAGLPVACSRIPPLEEVAGEAAIYFDPASEEQMARALQRITSDDELRAQLAVEGPRRAKLFSWENTAQLTRAALLSAKGEA
ncbi:MAG TPA: glycosyltransferase family 1 protein [Bryobacteraceae bacterium]|jgi:glycosyltransferase involved in cell wall biosynthesis|nr:glycosyltransferase family 1 protein [Bryobacteraceae bacterium]